MNNYLNATDATKLPLDRAGPDLYAGTMRPYLNASEIARLASVDRATVTRWIKKGHLEAARLGGSRWRIPLAAYAKLLKQRR